MRRKITPNYGDLDLEKDNEVIVVSAVRTPFSKFGGVLREIHSINLAVFVMKECLKRSGLKGEDLEELYYGMCIQSEAALESNVNARQALLRAGLPSNVVSLTIDRACCSSLTAVQLAFRSIRLEEANICMAVGAGKHEQYATGYKWFALGTWIASSCH